MGQRRIVILIALVVVGILFIVGALLLRGRGEREATLPPDITPTPTPEPVVVVIAKQNLTRGTIIRLQDLETQEWPGDAPPACYPTLCFTDPDDLDGRVVRSYIPQGTPILRSMLAGDVLEPIQGGSDLGLSINRGMRAIAIPLDMLGAVAWYIQPGDQVDILGSWDIVELDEEFQSPLPNRWILIECPEQTTCEGVLGRMELLPTGHAVMVYPRADSKNGYVAQVVVQNVTVMAVGPYVPQEEEGVELLGEGEPTPPPEEAAAAYQPTPTASNVVILMVTPQDALVIKSLYELQANIDLVMRRFDDDETINTTAVTPEYLVNRYGITEPPRLPFGFEAPDNHPLDDAYMQRAIQEALNPTQPQE